ncbi:MAG: HEAT repeat protein [Planctomycetota bacterium]|jgi:HEAT repeat protein
MQLVTRNNRFNLLFMPFLFLAVTLSSCGGSNGDQDSPSPQVNTANESTAVVRYKQYSRSDIVDMVKQIDSPSEKSGGLALQSLPSHPGHFIDEPEIAAEVIIPALIRIMNDSRHPTFQGLAATKLMGMGEFGKPAIPALIEAMKDSALRPFICHGISDMGVIGDAAIPTLATMLEASEAQVQIDACRGLTRFAERGASTLPQLCQLLESDSVIVQVAAVLALGSMKSYGKPALNALAPLLESKSDSVRFAARRSMKKIKSEK